MPRGGAQRRDLLLDVAEILQVRGRLRFLYGVCTGSVTRGVAGNRAYAVSLEECVIQGFGGNASVKPFGDRLSE